MTITISGKPGEGKSCVANIVRCALEDCGVPVDMGALMILERDVAQDVLARGLEVRVVVEESSG